jgi:hypothetical protein
MVLRQVLGHLNLYARGLWSDRYAKKLFVGNTVLLFLEAILTKRTSVEDIADHLPSSPWLQKWTGLVSIHASSLNRKLKDLPTDVLRQTYLDVVEQLALAFGLPNPLKHFGALAAVDATRITLGKKRGEWAYHQKGQNAVKVHTCLNLTSEQSAVPTATVLSTAAVADLDHEVMDHLVGEEGVTYLLDRGYIDYGQFLNWNRHGISFVARMKANSKVRVLREREKVSLPIQRDMEVELTEPHTGEVGRFRLVEYTFQDDKGKTHRVRALTNRWDLSSADVAQLYRYRWKVELFFKFMKQRLHLKKVYSAKRQAVWNQIYLNLIAYLLCEWCRQCVAPEQKIGRVMAKMKHYLARPWKDFLHALHPDRRRTSKGRRKKGGRPRIHPKRLKSQRLLYY